jgi:hypothetical protein
MQDSIQELSTPSYRSSFMKERDGLAATHTALDGTYFSWWHGDVSSGVAKAGCLIVAVFLLSGVAWALAAVPVARFGAAGLVVAIPVSLLFGRWRVLRAAQHFRRMHGVGGRDLLIVYSDSPHWKEYIESRWIERWRDRVVILNRSDPHWNARPEATLWRRVAGRNEHTPTAIVVPDQGRPQIVRFYSAFRENKHGKHALLIERERDLEARLDASRRP